MEHFWQEKRKTGRVVFADETWHLVFRKAADWLEKEKPTVWSIYCVDWSSKEFDDCRIQIYYYGGE